MGGDWDGVFFRDSVALCPSLSKTDKRYESRNNRPSDNHYTTNQQRIFALRANRAFHTPTACDSRSLYIPQPLQNHKKLSSAGFRADYLSYFPHPRTANPAAHSARNPAEESSGELGRGLERGREPPRKGFSSPLQGLLPPNPPRTRSN